MIKEDTFFVFFVYKLQWLKVISEVFLSYSHRIIRIINNWNGNIYIYFRCLIHSEVHVRIYMCDDQLYTWRIRWIVRRRTTDDVTISNQGIKITKSQQFQNITNKTEDFKQNEQTKAYPALHFLYALLLMLVQIRR